MKVRKNLVVIAAASAVILAMGVNAATSVESQHERRIQVLETQVRSLLTRVENLEKDHLAAKLPSKRRETSSPTKRRETSAPGPTYPERFGPGLQVGQIAYLGSNARVLQVVDGENMLVEIVTFLSSALSAGFTKETVWLKGISTTGLVDGVRLDTKAPLKITGTQPYMTSLGKTTVFLLEPLKK